MSTFADLKSRIADELARSDLTSQIEKEVLSAIRHYERERFWFNEGRATAPTTAGQANLAVPTDLLEIDSLDIDTCTGGLVRVGWDEFKRNGGTDARITGQPTRYTYYADQLWLLPVPDSTYTLTMSYLKQLTALSADSDSNAWTNDGEELIRARARQAVRINYAQDDLAINEAATMAARGEPFYSGAEKIAFLSLKRAGAKRRTIGRLRTPELAASGGFNIITG